MKEIQDTTKAPNLRIIGVEQSKDLQPKCPLNVFNKIVEESFPNLKEEMPKKMQETYNTPNRLDQKRYFSHHIIIKTPNILNKEY